MDDGFDGIRKKVKQWADFFATHDIPKPPERVRITEPVPLKVIITTRRGNKEVAWTTEEDFEKFVSNAKSWIGVEVRTTQQGGKGAGRSRKKVYRYVKDVEKG